MSGFVVPALFLLFIMETIKKFISRKRFKRALSLLIADVLLFATTNAATAPTTVIMLGFICLAVTLYYVAYGLTGLVSLYGLSVKRKRSFAIYLTLVVAGLLALQSIGQLGSRDLMVIMPLTALSYLYSSYAKTARRNLSG